MGRHGRDVERGGGPNQGPTPSRGAHTIVQARRLLHAMVRTASAGPTAWQRPRRRVYTESNPLPKFHSPQDTLHVERRSLPRRNGEVFRAALAARAVAKLMALMAFSMSSRHCPSLLPYRSSALSSSRSRVFKIVRASALRAEEEDRHGSSVIQVVNRYAHWPGLRHSTERSSV